MISKLERSPTTTLDGAGSAARAAGRFALVSARRTGSTCETSASAVRRNIGRKIAARRGSRLMMCRALATWVFRARPRAATSSPPAIRGQGSRADHSHPKAHRSTLASPIRAENRSRAGPCAQDPALSNTFAPLQIHLSLSPPTTVRLNPVAPPSLRRGDEYLEAWRPLPCHAPAKILLLRSRPARRPTDGGDSIEHSGEMAIALVAADRIAHPNRPNAENGPRVRETGPKHWLRRYSAFRRDRRRLPAPRIGRPPRRSSVSQPSFPTRGRQPSAGNPPAESARPARCAAAISELT